MIRRCLIEETWKSKAGLDRVVGAPLRVTRQDLLSLDKLRLVRHAEMTAWGRSTFDSFQVAPVMQENAQDVWKTLFERLYRGDPPTGCAEGPP